MIIFISFLKGTLFYNDFYQRKKTRQQSISNKARPYNRLFCFGKIWRKVKILSAHQFFHSQKLIG